MIESMSKPVVQLTAEAASTETDGAEMVKSLPLAARLHISFSC
jgi:hypothetical protein